MAVIVVAVVTQGFRVPQDTRGDVKSLLLVNSGFFQAVGVISFGMV
jgi:sodium-coupled neutral amino acid transporter 11